MEFVEAKNHSFDDALKMELSRSRLTSTGSSQGHIDRGYQEYQLKRLWRFFGKEAVLVLRQEDLLRDRIIVFNQRGKYTYSNAILPTKT